jgi:hypothetical protein
MRTAQSHDTAMLPMVQQHSPVVRPRPSYAIPLTDGSYLLVTREELATLSPAYQRAARRIVPSYAGRRRATGRASERPRHHRFPSILVLEMVILLVIVLVIAGYMAFPHLTPLWNTVQNDVRSGRPLPFQVDYNVGHGTPQHPESHFVAFIQNSRVVVIELPGDDPAHAKIYLGPPLNPQTDPLSLTLSFEDMNADGRPDLIIHVGDKSVIFLNQKDGTFKPPPKH